MCLFMKHNPMSINRGLCPIEKTNFTKSKVGEKHKISYGHSPKLLCKTQHLGCIMETNLR